MSKTEREKILLKIQKLLALSKSPNEHEATRAAERAQAMLVQYNLSMTDVETAEHEEDKITVDDETRTTSYPWRRRLASVVAKMYFCDYFYTTVGPSSNRRDKHSFVGAKHNIEVCKMMFAYLGDTVDRLAKEGALAVLAAERSAYRTSFRNACANRVCARIHERIAAAKAGKIQTEAGTNLPACLDLYDATHKRLQAYLTVHVPNLRTKRDRNAMPSAIGAIHGREAGNRIGLDQQVGQGNRGLLK